MNIPTNHADYMKLSLAEQELVPADIRSWLATPGFDKLKAQMLGRDAEGKLYFIDADHYATASNE